MITMNNAQGQPTAAFGGGAQYGAATGRTENFGYTNLAAGGNNRLAKGKVMGGGDGARTATPQLTNSVPIGMPAAPEPSKGGGHPSMPRIPDFLKGTSEGAGAGAGEAAAGVGIGAELADLAPLALAL